MWVRVVLILCRWKSEFHPWMPAYQKVENVSRKDMHIWGSFPGYQIGSGPICLFTRHAQLAWEQLATPNMENAPLHLMIIKLESCSGKIMENPCVPMLAMCCSTGLPKLCSTLILRHLGRRLKNQMECGVVTYTASTWPKLSWRVVS